MCTLCLRKKTCDYIFYNNLKNNSPITIIFGKHSPKNWKHETVGQTDGRTDKLQHLMWPLGRAA